MTGSLDGGPCRCGWAGDGEHMCHRCRSRPGSPRLVLTGPAALAGSQTKLGAYATHGCDACWEAYLRERLEALAAALTTPEHP